MAACGGRSSSNNSTAQVSRLKNRVFITNTYSGSLQIVDSVADKTAFTGSGINSQGQVVSGSPISIPVASSTRYEALSPDKTLTMVYDPVGQTLNFISNAKEASNGSISLGGFADMAVFSPDSKSVYAPVRNLPISGGRNGGVQVLDLAAGNVKTTFAVPSARYDAITPNGSTLLVFADDSDSVFLIDLTATTPTAVEVPGFARPVAAFFNGGDNNSAYILNCGPECGSSAGPPAVVQLDLPSKTIKASVPVAGATVGLLNNTTLYVAGTPGSTGAVDVVNISNMTKTTTNPIVIGDGYHSKMALASNSKLYIGAKTCSNTTTGCLSIVDTGSNTADAPGQPLGAVTGMQPIAGRNVMYVIEGGFLHIYDTTTGKLGPNQLTFQGALYDVVRVDP